MVAHEYAHAEAAYRQGDSTAYMLGRLTLNPAKHIDPFMTIILPLMLYYTSGFAFGGAKPVPVNPRNYRNYVRGDVIVSLAILILFAWFFVPLAFLIWLEDRAGSPLYGQARVGRGGREFIVWKFRSMRPDADQRERAQRVRQVDDVDHRQRDQRQGAQRADDHIRALGRLRWAKTSKH